MGTLDQRTQISLTRFYGKNSQRDEENSFSYTSCHSHIFERLCLKNFLRVKVCSRIIKLGIGKQNKKKSVVALFVNVESACMNMHKLSRSYHRLVVYIEVPTARAEQNSEWPAAFRLQYTHCSIFFPRSPVVPPCEHSL